MDRKEYENRSIALRLLISSRADVLIKMEGTPHARHLLVQDAIENAVVMSYHAREKQYHASSA